MGKVMYMRKGEVHAAPSMALADSTPAQIQAAAKAGTAANYWAVGDVVPITLNGKVGALTFSNETYYAFIIGFDHNSSREGSNTIHFQFGKTSNGKDFAFDDGNTDAVNVTRFCMNTSATNSGGWKSSYMRNTICSAFKSALPTAWQNIIAACTKYTDNTGGGSNTASYVTATSDKIWLPSEFELIGRCDYSNSAEANYQKQYDYYASGNSLARCAHNATSEECLWWLRSVRAEYEEYKNYFCYVNYNGDNYANQANVGYCFAPCFMVA